jgi:hypothetical protein
LKTKELIESLEKREREKFALVIKQHKRSTLAKLYEYLEKNLHEAQAWEKERLFACMSEEAYTKSKDYLLRNELRLLNEALETFIAQETALQKIASQDQYQTDLLLDAWLARGQTKRFEQDWRKAFDLALTQRDDERIYRLAERWADYYSQYKYPEKQAWEELQSILEQGLQHLNWANAERKADLERRWAWVVRTLWGLSPQAVLPSLPLFNEPAQPDIAGFLGLFSQSYLSQGAEKIAQTQAALALLPDILTFRPHFLRLEFSLLNNLALEYVFLAKFEESNPIFERLLHHPWLEQNQSLHLPILLNYCTNLGNQRQFERVLSLIQGQAQAIAQSAKLYHRFTALEVLSHLFLGQAHAAFEALQRNSIWEHPEHDYYYMRLLYVITYYLLDDSDSCQREITNIIQCVHYRTPANQDYVTMAKTFRRFIQLKESSPSAKVQRQAQQLLADVQAKRASIFDFNNLQTLWLQEEIERWLKLR